MSQHPNLQYDNLLFLSGGGEMGELIRQIEWNNHILGAPQYWPLALKQTVSMVHTIGFPTLICWGPEFIQFYNDAFRPILGISKHPEAIGLSAAKTFEEIWPTIHPMFDEVMKGKTVSFPNFLVYLDRNGFMEECYFDFSYSPVRDEYGKIMGVLVICMEITEKVLAIQKLEVANDEAEISRSKLMAERDKLNRFFMQAPAGICILDGPELTFELINPPYQQLFPGRPLLGKSVLDAVPEIRNQPIWDILQQVYQSGKTYEGDQLLIPLARTDDGRVEDRYFNFIYQARLNEKGHVDGILVFVFEVTDIVLYGKELSRTKDSLEIAISAAQLGTFDYDIVNKNLYMDERTRDLLGISLDADVSYRENILPVIHEEDKADFEKTIFEIINSTGTETKFDLEGRVKKAEDRQLKWLRAIGKVYSEDGTRPSRFSGTLMDITERKLDDIRKNDFIGMVSHELKTPLTSLSGIVQLLDLKLKQNEDLFISTAAARAYNQIKRMNNLIDGFLNMSRFESGKMRLTKKKFDLSILINEIIADTIMTAPEHSIHYENCKPVIANADRDKIGSVITNLLSNASKYSPKGKGIEVACSVESGCIRLSVKDQGIGINKKDLERIFDRYYRVETSQTQYIAGFGIGLYVSEEIIHGHGGEIWVESEIGKGSTFFFTIPLSSEVQ